MDRISVIKFYKEQIKKFEKIGLGNKTEFNTIVTEQLFDITRKRLAELQEMKLNRWIRKRGLNGFE
tara:strand:+ start:1216 stop:1413 length:198 start_codon:yes stop_codon:yes gene_type:complete